MGIFGKLFKPNVEKMEARKDFEGLIKALKHKDENIQLGAAGALGRIKDPRAVEPLIQALEGGGLGVKTLTIMALGEIEDKRAIEPIMRTVKWTGEIENLQVEALAEYGEGELGELGLLLKIQIEQYKRIRKYGATALAILSDERKDVEVSPMATVEVNPMATCDRCNAKVAIGEGYAVYSTAPMEFVTGEMEMGAMLFCGQCANDVFTEQVWKEAKDLSESARIEFTKTQGLAGMAALRSLIRKMHDFNVAMGAKRRGLGPTETRQEAQEIAQLWCKDQKAAQERLLQNVRGKKLIETPEEN